MTLRLLGELGIPTGLAVGVVVEVGVAAVPAECATDGAQKDGSSVLSDPEMMDTSAA